MSIPRAVIETDHRLEGANDQASLDLAKHRWEQCLDPEGPQHSMRGYAEAVERNLTTIRRYANGYAIYLQRMARPPGGAAFTIQDAIRLSEQSQEMQEYSEAIAKGAGVPIARVGRGDNRRKTREIIASAKERAERRGTDPLEEAELIAQHQRQSREMDRRSRDRKAQFHEARWLAIENFLAQAKIKLAAALKEAEGVDFDEEELDLLRGTISQVRSMLNLVDLRLAGTPDVDWDGELAKLGGGS